MKTREREVVLAAMYWVYTVDRHPELASDALHTLFTVVDAYRLCVMGTGGSDEMTDEILDFIERYGVKVGQV